MREKESVESENGRVREKRKRAKGRGGLLFVDAEDIIGIEIERFA